MNKDLIREKLSNTIETIEQTKTILELNYEKKYEVDFPLCKRREELGLTFQNLNQTQNQIQSVDQIRILTMK